MRVLVALQPAADKPGGKSVYAMLLPDSGDWGEVAVRKSLIEGFGVFPCDTEQLRWSSLDVPVLMCVDACADRHRLRVVRMLTRDKSCCRLQALSRRRVRHTRCTPSAAAVESSAR